MFEENLGVLLKSLFNSILFLPISPNFWRNENLKFYGKMEK